MTIWKYSIPVEDNFSLQLPKGAYVLTVELQDGNPHLWVMVDEDAPKVERRFYMAGTGHPLPKNLTRYIGTFHQFMGMYVFHVFEVE